MRNPIPGRLLLAAPLAALAACGGDQAASGAAPTEAGAATVTAVVQPRQLTMVPLDGARQPVGPAQEVAVQPVVGSQRLQLEPVTQ